MNARIFAKWTAAHVSIETHCAVTLLVLSYQVGLRQIFHAVSDHERMIGAVSQVLELHHRDETRQVVHLVFAVLAVHHACQVEQLGALVNLCPETMFQPFLGLFELLGSGHQVHVGKHTHDARKAVHLTHTK